MLCSLTYKINKHTNANVGICEAKRETQIPARSTWLMEMTSLAPEKFFGGGGRANWCWWKIKKILISTASSDHESNEMRLWMVPRWLTIWLTKRMIDMDIHMGPQGGLDLLFITASEFVYLFYSFAKLEPICIVQVVLKHTQSKWVMWGNSGNDTTVRAIILAWLYPL